MERSSALFKYRRSQKERVYNLGRLSRLFQFEPEDPVYLLLDYFLYL